MKTLLPSVSIIIPTLNEVDNIAPLISRIDSALSGKAEYEIIFVDDRSTDKTLEAITSYDKTDTELKRKIIVNTKKGAKGKAFSLIEGFEKASLDLICIIDADLQYPPEAIPEMINVIAEGYDVVVANRDVSGASFIRNFLSRIGRVVYGKFLNGLNCDVQSGLKLFRKAILDHMVLDATPWTFDISFLVQARDTGQKIGATSIPFAERHSGSSKVNVLKVGSEILIEAIRFRFGKKKTSAQFIKNANLDPEDEEFIAA